MKRDRRSGDRAARYVVIGLGGIGGLVLRLLVPFLYSRGNRATVLAVDGDRFEERNRERMLFTRYGPKAVVLAREIGGPYSSVVTVLPVPHYVTARNVRNFIEEGNVVFCQPDNHATRRLVERRCSRLNQVALFSGGNDGVEGGKTGTFGNVQVYLRQKGQDVTNPLSRFHPEIAHPADAPPDSRGCGASLPSAPQLLFTNAAVASAILGAFYAWTQEKIEYEEVYLDILRGSAVPVKRAAAPRSRTRRLSPSTTNARRLSTT